MIKTVGEKIRFIRGEMSRNEFISKYELHIDQQHLYKIETGARGPSPRLLKRICAGIGTPMSFFTDDSIASMEALPEELRDVGIEFLFVAGTAKRGGLTPEEFKNAVEFAVKFKQMQTQTPE